MSGSFTTYGRKLLLDGLFITPASVGTTYWALTYAIPGTSDDVTRLVEPIGMGYARVAYALAGGWTAGQPGEVWNSRAITFGAPSANWGVLRGWALCSALTGGKVIASGSLRAPTIVNLGQSAPVIGANSVRMALR